MRGKHLTFIRILYKINMHVQTIKCVVVCVCVCVCVCVGVCVCVCVCVLCVCLCVCVQSVGLGRLVITQRRPRRCAVFCFTVNLKVYKPLIPYTLQSSVSS